MTYTRMVAVLDSERREKHIVYKIIKLLRYKTLCVKYNEICAYVSTIKSMSK